MFFFNNFDSSFIFKTEEKERTVVFTAIEVKRCNDPFRCRLFSNLISYLLLLLKTKNRKEKNLINTSFHIFDSTILYAKEKFQQNQKQTMRFGLINEKMSFLCLIVNYFVINRTKDKDKRRNSHYFFFLLGGGGSFTFFFFLLFLFHASIRQFSS